MTRIHPGIHGAAARAAGRLAAGVVAGLLAAAAPAQVTPAQVTPAQVTPAQGAPAQGAPAQGPPGASAQLGMPPPPRVQSAGGIEFVNGGAGEEARVVIAAMQANFSLRLVFSDPTGAYVVVDRVRVRQGPGEVFSVDGAGPLLLIRLLPGDYTVEATHAGKLERRQVQLGRDRVTLHWRVPADAPASAPR